MSMSNNEWERINLAGLQLMRLSGLVHTWRMCVHRWAHEAADTAHSALHSTTNTIFQGMHLKIRKYVYYDKFQIHYMNWLYKCLFV